MIPIPCSGVLIAKRKDKVQRVIPAGWRQKGHQATKTLLQFLMDDNKNGRVQPVVPCGQPHLPTRNRMMGNPANLQDGVPVIMKVIDLVPCREAGGGGDGSILLMFQTA